MTISYEALDYDQFLTRLLQNNIRLTVDNKIIRQGQLVLYGYKNYHIELYFKNKKDGSLRKTEVPIPFKIYKTKDDNVMYFDYNLDIICSQDFNISIPEENKFLNKRMKVEVQDGC